MSKNKTVLITGASKGIGLKLAKLFAKDKHNLILIARNENELQSISADLKKLYSIEIYCLAIDLSETQAAQQVFDFVQKEKLFVEILVNNAGFGNYGLFYQNNFQREIEMLELNINTLTKLTHLFLQPMIESRHGKILNLASTAAFLPGPLMANYYASKAYVLSFSIALANELRAFNIQVSVVCPGPTKTNFSKTAGLEHSKLFKSAAMNVETVAKIAYQDFKKSKTLIVPGFKNKIITCLSRFLPLKFAARMARQAQSENNN